MNHKRLKRLMREHGLNARRRRRYVATTDSDHDQPIFPDRTKDMVVDGPHQLWVADLTYIAAAVGFVYVALAIVLEPCVDGSRGARAVFGGWVWSVAAMCAASDLQRDGCAP